MAQAAPPAARTAYGFEHESWKSQVDLARRPGTHRAPSTPRSPGRGSESEAAGSHRVWLAATSAGQANQMMIGSD